MGNLEYYILNQVYFRQKKIIERDQIFSSHRYGTLQCYFILMKLQVLLKFLKEQNKNNCHPKAMEFFT